MRLAGFGVTENFIYIFVRIGWPKLEIGLFIIIGLVSRNLNQTSIYLGRYSIADCPTILGCRPIDKMESPSLGKYSGTTAAAAPDVAGPTVLAFESRSVQHESLHVFQWYWCHWHRFVFLLCNFKCQNPPQVLRPASATFNYWTTAYGPTNYLPVACISVLNSLVLPLDI